MVTPHRRSTWSLFGRTKWMPFDIGVYRYGEWIGHGGPVITCQLSWRRVASSKFQAYSITHFPIYTYTKHHVTKVDRVSVDREINSLAYFAPRVFSVPWIGYTRLQICCVWIKRYVFTRHLFNVTIMSWASVQYNSFTSYLPFWSNCR